MKSYPIPDNEYEELLKKKLHLLPVGSWRIQGLFSKKLVVEDAYFKEVEDAIKSVDKEMTEYRKVPVEERTMPTHIKEIKNGNDNGAGEN